MHSNIAALSTSVPCLAISYSYKYQGIMKLFEMEDYVIKFKKLTGEVLQEKFNHLQNNSDNVKNKMIKINKRKNNYKNVISDIIKSQN